MTSRPLEDIVATAREQGLLPADAVLPPDSGRPWPVVLLTGLGAWLAVIPLLGVAALMLGGLLETDAGPYLFGIPLIAGAVLVLRASRAPTFLEQFCVPLLMAGLSALGIGLLRDLDVRGGSLALAVVSLGIAALVRAPWLRTLAGAASAVLVAIATAFDSHALVPWWLAWHLVLGLALLAQAAPRPATAAALLEPAAAGWLLVALLGLAWWSGRTFLVGGGAGGLLGDLANDIGPRDFSASPAWRLQQGTSALLTLAAAFWASRRWSGLRRWPFLGAALVAAGLAFLMPSLGAQLLVLAACATSGRGRLAVAAGLAAAWTLGAFYYQLAWPLATKASVLVAAGALLGAVAVWVLRRGTAAAGEPAAAPSHQRRIRLGLVASLLAVLGVANVGIGQKEALIRNGVPVFVALAPVDPRSLMQGDYMRLNFNLPGGAEERRGSLMRVVRPSVVARLDGRGIATLLRIDDGTTPLASDERRIELTPKNGQWTLVSDAWFFTEGEASRWAAARYGEFRVDAEGHALLVGLRGADLAAL